MHIPLFPKVKHLFFHLTLFLLIFVLFLVPVQTASADTISFSTPINVSNTLASSKLPSIAADNFGSVHAIWWEGPSTSSDRNKVVYSTMDQDELWSAAFPISDLSMLSAVHGHIATDDNGNLHAIWYATVSVDNVVRDDVFYATRPVGGGWSIPTRIADGRCNSLTASTTPLVVGPDGTVHVVCDSYGSAIFYTKKSSGGAWITAFQITGESGSANPVIALDQGGGVHVAWERSGIKYTTKPVNGEWIAPISISNIVSAGRSSITTDVTGQIYVAWGDTSLGPRQVFFAMRTAGGIWTTPINLSNTASDSDFPSLASRGDLVHLVWEEGGDILYRMRGVNGMWSASQNISTGPGFAGYPTLTTSTGALHVAWSEVALNGELDIFYSAIILDSTPPVITPVVTGTLGNNDWYTSDVNVSWDVNDPESEVTSTNGCDPSTVTTDTAGATFTCQATSAGGTASESATIKRDATVPAISITSPDNFAVVPVGTTLNFSASDNLSGLEIVTGHLSDGTTTQDISSGFSVTAAGVYTLNVEAKDNAGNSANETRYFVVYDPASGFATGGGWLVPGGTTSDTGDQLPGLDNTSRAEFGFVVKYKPGATTPDGQLEFQYKQGDFNLHSTGMEWLVVVNNNWAKFQGKATIKGFEGEYYFRVDGRDGDYGGGNQQDRFIIKIWSPLANPDQADPIYKASGDLQGGNIVIHTK